MRLLEKCVKTCVVSAALVMLAIPAVAGSNHSPAGETGNWLKSTVFNLDTDLLVRGGNGNGGGGNGSGGGSGNGGNGSGDGSGSGGDAPGDGTGNGAGTGEYVNV